MGKQESNGEEVYHITLWGCLSSVLLDYNIDLSHITPRMGEHMVNDFMEALENQGYLKYVAANKEE